MKKETIEKANKLLKERSLLKAKAENAQYLIDTIERDSDKWSVKLSVEQWCNPNIEHQLSLPKMDVLTILRHELKEHNESIKSIDEELEAL